MLFIGCLADAAGNPLIQFTPPEAPGAAELECRDLPACR
jgi:hypothetical protein